MVPYNFQVLAKFGLCLICSLKLDGCSLARASKIFAIARMLGFSITRNFVNRKRIAVSKVLAALKTNAVITVVLLIRKQPISIPVCGLYH